MLLYSSIHFLLDWLHSSNRGLFLYWVPRHHDSKKDLLMLLPFL